MSLPVGTRTVAKLLGSGEQPGPLMIQLLRECNVPRHWGSSPATRRAELRRRRGWFPKENDWRDGKEEVVVGMIESNRERWERKILAMAEGKE